jgi:hypothetical protein
MTDVAEHIGCGTEAARAAIWDLGLWPALVRARAEASSHA